MFQRKQAKPNIMALIGGLALFLFSRSTAFAAIAADVVPPTGSLFINNNATYTNSTQVTLNPTAADAGSGVAQMQFSNDKVTWSALEPYASSKAWNLSSAVGQKYVFVRFKDNAGNLSAIYYDGIILDATLPTGVVYINSRALNTNATQVTLSLSATDTYSGLSQMSFSNDNAVWSAPEIYKATKTWSMLSGDGTKTVFAKFQDKAGNWSTVYSDTILLDTTPPTTSNIRTTNITAKTASVWWDTNETATAQVEYGLTTAYGSKSAASASLVTSRGIALSALKEYTLYHYRVISKDALGNQSVSGDYTFTTLDITPPTGSVFINHNAAYTNISNVSLSLNAQDTGSGLSQMKFSNDNVTWSAPEPYATTKAWALISGTGARASFVKFKDNAGNWSTAYSDTIIVETTVPKPTVLINANASYANSPAVTLTISATDTGSGMGAGAQMQFSNDNSIWSAPEAFAATTLWNISPGDGTKTVYIKCKDAAGNWSTPVSDTILLHTIPPVISDVKASTILANSAYISWATDEPADAQVEYGLTTAYGFKTALSGGLPTNRSIALVNLKEYTVYHYRVISRDFLGNQSISEDYTFTTLDVTPPAGTISINNNAIYTNIAQVTLTVMATDTGSGVSQMQFSNDNITWSLPEAYTSTRNWAFDNTISGGKTVYVKFKDSAGNWSSAAPSRSIVFDLTLPTGTISINNNAGMGNSSQVSLNLSASDLAGIAQMQFSNDSINWSTPEAFAATKAWVLSSGDGPKTVYVKFKDNAENWSAPIGSNTLFLDTTPPYGTITINDGRPYSTTGWVTLTFAIQDAASGMGQGAQMQFSTDAVVWSTPETYVNKKSNFPLPSGEGEKAVYARFKDRIGNWSGVISASIIVDTTPPAAPLVTDDGDETRDRTQFHCRWASSDSLSGVAEYSYRITQDSVSGSVIADWTSAGAATEVTRPGMTLLTGKKYYVTVKARNNAGRWSLNGYSDGITIISGPTTPVVIDEGDYTGSYNSLHASWSADDPDSSIAEYKYSIGTQPGYTDVYNWTSTTSNGITVTGLTIRPSYRYYFNVKARNSRGEWGKVGSSDGIRYDSAPDMISFTPANNSAYTETNAVPVVICARDLMGDSLEFQIKVDGVVAKPWFKAEGQCPCSPGVGAQTTYVWQTKIGDGGLHTIRAEVRDNKVTPVSRETTIFLYRRPFDPPS